MNEKFLNENPGKYYFDYNEIILQCCPEYENSESFYNRMYKILTPALSNLNIDIKLFEVKYKQYRIPILFAEVIYLIVREANVDSQKNSLVSKIKNNKFDKLSFNDKVTFIMSFFAELKKDYPCFEKYIEKVEFNFLYPYYNVKDLMSFGNELNEIEKMIELPLIGYDKKINEEFRSFFTEVGKDIKEEYKEQYNQILNHAGHELIEQLLSLRGSTNLLSLDNELNECFETLKADISKLKSVVERVKSESEEAHKNHLLYIDLF